jgi:hypothetical protein
VYCARPHLAVYRDRTEEFERWHRSFKGSASGQGRRHSSMMHGVSKDTLVARKQQQIRRQQSA